MRITRYTPRKNTPPYNRIFESYGDVLSKLFEERADIDPVTSYVQMPGPQQELIDFALSGNQDVGLLVGDIGIGKSSLLKFLREAVWPTHRCLPLFRDFSARSENINLPTNFYELPEKGQRQRALNLANAKVVSMIKEKVFPWLKDDIRENPQTFFDFLERWYPEYVPDEAVLASDEPKEMLKLVQQKSKQRFFLSGFHYYIQSHDIHHIKFVVDNLDDKEAMLTHSTIELAAHLARGIVDFNSKELKVNPTGPKRWMTVIVACRPNTAEIIQHADHRSGNRWHGFHEIPIREPCSLAAAIKGRYSNVVKSKEFPGSADRALRFTLGDKPWTIEDRDSFFEGICDAFDSSGQAEQILAFCNNNVASAMASVMDVTRNRHFVKDEELIAAALPRSSSHFQQFAKSAFTRTTVLRSLAYGNQGTTTKPVYPIDHSPVINILDSPDLSLGASTFKPRVIGMFVHKANDAKRFTSHISLNDICNLGVQYLGLTYETAESIVDEMFGQGLLGNSRIVALPSKVGSECLLTLRPRGDVLWRLLGEDSILLQCYRDDSELDSTLEWNERHAQFLDRPTLEMLIEDVGHELVWMIRQVWQREERELTRLASASRYGEFTYICGKETVTERLLRGVENSRKRFYKRYSDIENQILESSVSELFKLVNEKKTEWEATIAESDTVGDAIG